MTFIDWTIIAVFLIGLTLIGFLFSKSNRNLEDYFLGGRSMPTWLVAFAATGTSISAGTFVGSPELGFNTNLTYLMLCVGAILGGTLVALLVLPKLYNANTITITATWATASAIRPRIRRASCSSSGSSSRRVRGSSSPRSPCR